MTGKIVRMIGDKGFGFIKEDGGNGEFFFHRSAVRGVDFESLANGDKVEFEEEDGPKGPRATDVRLMP